MSKNAFSLVEVMVAIFILVVGLVAVLHIFPFGLHIEEDSKRATIADYLARARMEEMISLSYDEISEGIFELRHPLDSPFNTYERTTEVVCVNAADPDLPEVSCAYNPVNDPNPLKKIKVTVFFEPLFGTSEEKISLISLITKR
jgi:prepilin-type N-terminal cleavage/methylation domain-containing protein